MDSNVHPSIDEVKNLLNLKVNKGKNLVPIVKEILGDLETPVSAFLKVRKGNHSFLLESVVGGENRGRYSFIGTNPFKILKVNDEDPLLELEASMKQYKPVEIPSLNLPPLTGGAVGFVCYEAVKYFEPRVSKAINKQDNPLDIPDALWMFVNSVVIFDHVSQVVKIVTHCHTDTPDIDTAYKAAIVEINKIERQLSKPLSLAESGARGSVPTSTLSDFYWESNSNTGRAGFEGFVKSLKEEIVAGNIIQAVPSQRIHKPLPEHISGFDLYRHLRRVNPSPYMFYVESGPDIQIVGASPEMLVKVDADRKVETHPIAGTIKRGLTPSEDAMLAKKLLADEKERAEHIMLVDLGRNDIGRVASPGTVSVDDLMIIEKYSHVQHIVSKVSGTLSLDKSIYDAFRSVFPAGTVSGAPKVSAIERVAELESERRYIYAGAVGYVSYRNVLDTAIAIRTIVIHKKIAYFQAGAGITFDSDPSSEYKETCNKLLGVVKALDTAAAMTNSHENGNSTSFGKTNKRKNNLEESLLLQVDMATQKKAKS